MTTYRERREARAERLRGYAEKRQTDAAAVFADQERFVGDHAFNFQPGHIPERAREIKRRDRAHESVAKASGMESRANGIESQLASSIYSDDPDAVEALDARIATLEAERDRVKTFNALRRKRKPVGPADGIAEDGAAAGLTGAELSGIRSGMRVVPYQYEPYGAFPAYHLSNLSGNINRQKKRRDELVRAAAVVAAGGRGRGRSMDSRYGGTCPDCGESFEKGAAIVYYRLTREAVHAACAAGGAFA